MYTHSSFRLVAWAVPAALLACTGQAPAPRAPAPVSKSPSAVQTAGPSTAARLGIPPGQLPPPGKCRIWFPGKPPGQQPKAGACSALEPTAPAGSWIVYRPTADKKQVYVREVDPARAGVVTRVQVFDAATGAFLRNEKP